MDLFQKKINFNYLLHENNTIDNSLYLPENNLKSEDLPTIQRLVGHENISTTERHYLNVGDKHLQEAAQRMPSFTTVNNTSNQDKLLEAVENKKEINIDLKYIIDNFETVKQLVELLKSKERE